MALFVIRELVILDVVLLPVLLVQAFRSRRA